MAAKVLTECSPIGVNLAHKAGLMAMPDAFWNAAVEAMYFDYKVLADVVMNIQVDGICKHFSDLFEHGQGGLLIDEPLPDGIDRSFFPSVLMLSLRHRRIVLLLILTEFRGCPWNAVTIPSCAGHAPDQPGQMKMFLPRLSKAAIKSELLTGTTKALSMNVDVLQVALQVWGEVTPVSTAHQMLSGGGKAQTVAVYVDSWGIKRLATLAMRRWKDRSLHVLFDVMTAAWGVAAEPEPEGEIGDDADGYFAAEDAYDAAPEADGPGPVAGSAAVAEDPLDAELRAMQQQLESHFLCPIYMKMNLRNPWNCDLRNLQLPLKPPLSLIRLRLNLVAIRRCNPEPEGQVLKKPEEEFDVLNFKGNPSPTEQHGICTNGRGHAAVEGAVAEAVAEATQRRVVTNVAEGHEEEHVETPQKVSPPKKAPKAKAKAKAKVAKAAQELPSKASPSKSSPSKPKAKASPKAKVKASSPKPKSSAKAKASKPETPSKAAPAGEGSEVRKRKRHSDDEKSFARRAKPKSEKSLNHWTAIRDVYNAQLFAKYAASHQDGFWMLAKPRMEKAASLEACIKAFVALVLLAYWLDPKPPFCNEAFDVIELFAGRARITRLAQAAGYQAVAADQKYDLHETSSLHMNESSGFVLAVLMILSGSAQGAIAILGIECSTFVDSVSDANEATSRTCLLLVLLSVLGHHFFVENPGSKKLSKKYIDRNGKQRIYPPLFARKMVDLLEPCREQPGPSVQVAIPNSDKPLQDVFNELSWDETDWEEANLGIAKHGVVKKEDDGDEQEILKQIEARKPLLTMLLEDIRKARWTLDSFEWEAAEEAPSKPEDKAESERRAQESADEAEANADVLLAQGESERQARAKAEADQVAVERAKLLLAEQEAEQAQLAEERAQALRRVEEESEGRAKEQAKLLRLAQEKAETERVMKERAEVLLAEQKAERERMIKEQAEVLKEVERQKAKSDRLAKERADAEDLRKEQEKAETERLMKERAEQTMAQENAEALRRAQTRAATVAEIEAHKAKKEELKKAQARLSQLQAELQTTLQETATYDAASDPASDTTSRPDQPTVAAAAVTAQPKTKEIFISKFSIEREKQLELETQVDFEFLTKQQMSEEIDECVQKAQKDPTRKIRKHPYKVGHLTYYCEIKVKGHNRKSDRVTMTERMYAKIRAVYSDVDACCEKMQALKAEGVLDGYTDQLITSSELETRARAILATPKVKSEAGKVTPNRATLFVLWLSAPACVIGEIAEAVVADGSATQNIREAAKMDKSHSERNAHRLFNRYGLALRVPISFLDVPSSNREDSITIPHLKITDFLKLLLNSFEEVLFGGLKADSDAARDLCSTFWSRYQKHHPEHVIYSEVDAKDRSLCIPVLVHGDKGRTLQKSPIFVMSFELVWGLPLDMLKKVAYDTRRNTRHDMHDGHLKWSCGRRAAGKRSFSQMCFDSCTVHDSAVRLNPRKKGNAQRHNNRGHSYLSRFLIAAIPSKVYNKNESVLPSLLKQAAVDLQDCFQHGLVHEKSGTRYRFVFLGAKGDAEWHFEAGCFTRSYHRSGTVHAAPICPLCDAGAEGLSYTDVSDAPKWLGTVGSSVPWESTPPLNLAPFSTTFPANLYKYDPFHVLKFGIFRDAVGSTIVRLALMGYFDFSVGEPKNITQRLIRGFSLYKLWCLASGKNPSLRCFTKANLKFETSSKFAWINCKGSEVVMLMQWLDFLVPKHVAEPKQASDLVFLRAVAQMIRGGLDYVGIMRSHGIWLPLNCGKVQLHAGLAFARGYAFLAQHLMDCQTAGFRLRPKLHYLMHLLMPLKSQIDNDDPWVLNQAIHLCEANEDFIGRLARVSRRVHPSQASLRTTQRYLVKVRLLLERLLK
ncbi:unnamed protein product [Symbiodinium sp. KB8]|nr:unnamed protein product [Symbiodinium sp. KB8]